MLHFTSLIESIRCLILTLLKFHVQSKHGMMSKYLGKAITNADSEAKTCKIMRMNMLMFMRAGD